MVTIKSYMAYITFLVDITAVDFCPALLILISESMVGKFPENVLK